MKRLNLNQWEKVKTAFWSSDHAFSSPLFLLLIFLLPTQFGRHFWFPFSYVNGLRLDYLAITLYTTDVLLFVLFVLFLLQEGRKLMFWLGILLSHTILLGKVPVKTSFLIGMLMGYVFFNILFSQSPWISLYGWTKVTEVSFLAFSTTAFCRTEKRRILCIRAFLLGGLLQAVLALLQYHAGGSLGGLWYFLGERYYTGSTPGIANASIFGQLMLRPYGTLPHPNVLAAYLLFGLYFLLCTPHLFSPKLSRVSVPLLSVMFFIALVLTLSRTALVLTLPLFLFSFLSFFSKRKTFFALSGVVLVVLFLFPMLWGRFGSISFTEESVINREFLVTASLEIIRHYPVLGTGLFAFLPTLGKANSLLSYDLLQPVHSLPFLIAAELGLPATGMIALFVWRGLSFFWKRRNFSALLLIFLTVFLSLFDHYFWTLQQGQLLLGFSLGMLFSLRSKSVEKLEKTRGFDRR